VTATGLLRAALLRARLLFLVARPPLVLLLGLYVALGVAEAGRAEDCGAVASALLVVVGYVACSVGINDLADLEVDRINVPDDPSRALASGAASVLEVRVLAVAGAALSVVAAAFIGWTCALTTLAALVVAAAYSMPPFQISRRGIVAPLVLPLGFVAVPFLAGVLAVRPALRLVDLALLGGLYLGFVGRILLKDFRDVRGDALLGKRTFLVRRGRVWTCRLSAVLWVAGSSALLAVRQLDVALVAAYGVLLVVALVLLGALSRSSRPRHDEAVVGAIAMVGRGLILSLLVHYGTLQLGTRPWLGLLAQALVTVTLLAGAADIARHGLTATLFAPVAAPPVRQS
jgi:4-hydroxybenzoate polyprenyltransferase